MKFGSYYPLICYCIQIQLGERYPKKNQFDSQETGLSDDNTTILNQELTPSIFGSHFLVRFKKITKINFSTRKYFAQLTSAELKAL